MNDDISPFSLKNIRLFIGLRIFFNCRFYYPVFTILFLDYGLSLEQFAILNAAWAATIVLFEVPSGAMADIIGRRQLLIITSLLMLLEMAIIAFVPLADINVVFWVFLVNRILSGLAEALASGADEALAYDTLITAGLEKKWPLVLDVQMRSKAAVSFLTMSIGAMIYDPQLVNGLLHFFHIDITVVQQQSMRFPVYLTLLLALCSLGCSWAMTEPMEELRRPALFSTALVTDALRKTFEAGRWILATPFALTIILFGMAYDHTLRMVVTMTSEYFRQINLPVASFGLIGAAMSLVGIFIPRLARYMAERYTPLQICLFIGLKAIITLWGLSLFIPYFGILPMMMVYSGMILTSFFTSHYLNRITDSEHRATVLSFKGLVFNMAYGGIGVLFASWVHSLEHNLEQAHPDWTHTMIGASGFREALSSFIWYGPAMVLVVTLFSVWNLRNTDQHRLRG